MWRTSLRSVRTISTLQRWASSIRPGGYSEHWLVGWSYRPIGQVSCENVPMVLRLPSLLDVPIGFAHRGARAHAPENTPEAFDLAVKLGATGIESDVWLSNDGALMLDHDGKIGLRRRPIGDVDREQLPATMITLPELFDRLPGDLDVSIDIKDDAAAQPLFAWASDRPIELRRRLFLCHHNWELLADWRQLDPHVRLIDSTALKTMPNGPEKRAHQLAEAGIDGVNLRQDEWTGGMAALFHRFGRLCFGWDAQHERMVRELIRIGIDGIFSDHVDMLMRVISDASEPAPNGPG